MRHKTGTIHSGLRKSKCVVYDLEGTGMERHGDVKGKRQGQRCTERQKDRGLAERYRETHWRDTEEKGESDTHR